MCSSCLYICTIPAPISSPGVVGGTPLQQLPEFVPTSFPPHVFKIFLLSIGPTMAACSTVAGGRAKATGKQVYCKKELAVFPSPAGMSHIADIFLQCTGPSHFILDLLAVFSCSMQENLDFDKFSLFHLVWGGGGGSGRYYRIALERILATAHTAAQKNNEELPYIIIRCTQLLCVGCRGDG